MRRVDRYWVLFGALMVLMLAAVAGAWYLVRSPWFQNRVQTLVVGRLSQTANVKVEMERFRAGVGIARIEGLRLVDERGDPARVVFSARAISLRFNLMAILFEPENFWSVVLESPRLWLYGGDGEADSTRGWSLPPVPPLLVKRMRISAGRLYLVRRDTLVIDEVELSGRLSSVPGGMTVELAKASFRPPWGGGLPVGLSGRFRLTGAGVDSIRMVTDVSLSRVRTWGSVDLGGSTADLSFELDPVYLEDVAAWAPSMGERLKGRATGTGRVRGPIANPSLTAHLQLQQSGLLGRELERITVSGRMDSTGIDLSDLRLVDGKTSITGSLSAALPWKEKNLDARLQFQGLDPARWLPDGRSGPSGDLNGRLHIKVSGADAATMDVAGNLALDASALAGYSFQGARADFSYRDGRLNLESLELVPLADGAGLVTARGNAGAEGMSFEVTLDRIALDSVGKILGVEGLGGSAGGRANIFGQLDDPNLIAALQLEGITFGPFKSSRAEVRIDLDRLTTDGGGRLELNAAGVELGGTPINSIRLQASGHPKAFDLEEVELNISPEYMVQAEGEAALFSDRLNVELGRLSVQLKGQMVGNTQPMMLSISPEGVEIESLEMFHGRGTANLTGFWRFEGPSDLELDLKHLDLEALGLAFNWGERLRGSLSLGARIRGELRQPSVALDCLVEEGEFRSYAFDRLAALMSYDSGRVTVDSLEMVRDSTRIDCSGVIALPMFSPDRGIEERRLAFSGRGRNVPLSYVNEFTGSVEFRSGIGSLTFAVAGTLAKPEIDGGFVFTGARAFVPAIATEFEKVGGRVELSSTGLKLSSITGSVVRGSGKGSVDGWITFKEFHPDSLRLDFQATNLRVSNIPNIDGWVSTSDLHLTGPVAKPLLAGRLRMVEGTISVPFGENKTEEESPREIAAAPDIDLAVTAENNVWLRNEQANVELTGEIGVKLTNGSLTLSGQLETIRGTYTLGIRAPTRSTALRRDLQLYTRDFSITRGTILFRADPRINPELNIEATAMVVRVDPGISPDKSQSGRNSGNSEIDLILSGTLKNPEYRLFSQTDPDLTENEIYSLLLFDTPMDREQRAASDLSTYGGSLSEELKFKAVDVVENLVAQQMRQEIGLDTIRLDTELFGAQRDVTVTAGKYVSRRIYLSGSASLQGETSGLVEYYLNRTTSFIGEVDNYGDYNVYIKYRIRY